LAPKIYTFAKLQNVVPDYEESKKIRNCKLNWNKMTSVDKIRSGLIDKILAIRNKDFLVALDNLISSSSANTGTVELTSEQKEMLQMSELDIANGRLISQEAMDKRNMEWLNGL
jgi:archaellum component FlaF (FlaF/FlaG flagellin family)